MAIRRVIRSSKFKLITDVNIGIKFFILKISVNSTRKRKKFNKIKNWQMLFIEKNVHFPTKQITKKGIKPYCEKM